MSLKKLIYRVHHQKQNNHFINYFGKAVVFLFKNILERAPLPTIAKTFLTKLRILVMSEDQPKDKSSDKLNSLMPGGNKKVTHT